LGLLLKGMCESCIEGRKEKVLEDSAFQFQPGALFSRSFRFQIVETDINNLCINSILMSAKSQAPKRKKASVRQDSSSGSNSKRARKDVADTYGVRGAGATWQADFGMPLNEEDLLFAIRREPVAKRVVFDVAHDIFNKWFTVEEVAEKPDPNWSREVSKVLDDLNAKAVFTVAAVYERLFGWSFIALSYVDHGEDISKPVDSPQEIRELVAYSSLQASVQGSDEDKDPKSERFGLPVLYTLRRSGAAQTKLHFSRAIHLATRLLDHPWKGLSVLEILYDDLTVFRNERWGLGQTLFRVGAGFADVTIKDAKKKDIDELEASQQFTNLNNRTYFLHGDDKTLDFKGVAGKALNPEPYVKPVVESLSCGSRIPEAILRGAQAGALTGSEVNEREYFGFISSLQALYEPYIWNLIERLMKTGQIRRVNDYRIVWRSGLELSEKDKAAVELQKAQTLNFKTSWLTVDEIRALEGKDPLPDGAGNLVLGLKKAEQQPFSQALGADVGPFTWIISRLRRKKKDANIQNG
jgi:phage-related protein (TIGR01555 family)